MKDKTQQEQYCLQVKMLSDMLRTKILMIEGFPDWKYYDRQLKNIKKIADELYWKL